ncbi:hypothetical protein JHK85_053331 [Glycine max]|nr:hypothetical protein JHK85_053331 [Glycine max]
MAQARDASSPITTSCNRSATLHRLEDPRIQYIVYNNSEDLDDDGDDDETDDIHGDDPIRGLNHSGLGLEKGASSSKSQSDSNKCDFYGKSKHSNFRCIHEKTLPPQTSQPSPKLASPPLSKKEVATLEKAKKKSLVETRKKVKLDKTLEKNEAFELDKAKEFEEILDDDIMESLKTLFVEEQMKSIDIEVVLEAIILEFVLAHYEVKVRRVELDELERVQFAIEHGVALMSLYVVERQAKL